MVVFGMLVDCYVRGDFCYDMCLYWSGLFVVNCWFLVYDYGCVDLGFLCLGVYIDEMCYLVEYGCGSYCGSFVDFDWLVGYDVSVWLVWF